MCDARATQEHCGMCSVFFFFNFFFNFTLVTVDLSLFAGVAGLPGWLADWLAGCVHASAQTLSIVSGSVYNKSSNSGRNHPQTRHTLSQLSTIVRAGVPLRERQQQMMMICSGAWMLRHFKKCHSLTLLGAAQVIGVPMTPMHSLSLSHSHCQFKKCWSEQSNWQLPTNRAVWQIRTKQKYNGERKKEVELNWRWCSVRKKRKK